MINENIQAVARTGSASATPAREVLDMEIEELGSSSNTKVVTEFNVESNQGKETITTEEIIGNNSNSTKKEALIGRPHPPSHLDTDPNLHVTFRYLRTYLNSATAAAAANDPFQIISAILSAALVHYYPLAATLHQNHLFCNIKNLTVPLIYATVDDTTLDSLNYLDNNLDTHFLEQLVPDPNQEERLVNPCVLQVMVFKCGGFTLRVIIRHLLCDGLGVTQFFNVMAELAYGATRVLVKPMWDRMSLLGPRDLPRVKAPIHEFLSLEKGFSSYSEETSSILRECFNVSDECFKVNSLVFWVYALDLGLCSWCSCSRYT
ncbi:hypothetical protein SO802_012014 [Lithocarpus litseifolius]|uniref:Uncharacterized protein n=1 Tax=Lithocarpus litseifolius TaxID=425828 RepID=A0AAW2D411_9ROSI